MIEFNKKFNYIFFNYRISLVIIFKIDAQHFLAFDWYNYEKKCLA